MGKEAGSDLGVSVFAVETSLGRASGGGVCALSRVLSWRPLFQQVRESKEAV